MSLKESVVHKMLEKSVLEDTSFKEVFTQFLLDNIDTMFLTKDEELNLPLLRSMTGCDIQKYFNGTGQLRTDTVDKLLRLCPKERK